MPVFDPLRAPGQEYAGRVLDWINKALGNPNVQALGDALDQSSRGLPPQIGAPLGLAGMVLSKRNLPKLSAKVIQELLGNPRLAKGLTSAEKQFVKLARMDPSPENISSGVQKALGSSSGRDLAEAWIRAKYPDISQRPYYIPQTMPPHRGKVLIGSKPSRSSTGFQVTAFAPDYSSLDPTKKKYMSVVNVSPGRAVEPTVQTFGHELRHVAQERNRARAEKLFANYPTDQQTEDAFIRYQLHPAEVQAERTGNNALRTFQNYLDMLRKENPDIRTIPAQGPTSNLLNLILGEAAKRNVLK